MVILIILKLILIHLILGHLIVLGHVFILMIILRHLIILLVVLIHIDLIVYTILFGFLFLLFLVIFFLVFKVFRIIQQLILDLLIIGEFGLFHLIVTKNVVSLVFSLILLPLIKSKLISNSIIYRLTLILRDFTLELLTPS